MRLHSHPANSHGRRRRSESRVLSRPWLSLVAAVRPGAIMSSVISKVIMWLAWSFAAALAVLMANFLTRDIPMLNSFSRPFDVFATGMFLIPTFICGGLRFWLSRIRNPWLALLPFLGGVFFAWQAGLYGIFLLPEFCIMFQILSVILFLVYAPLFVRIDAPPPLG